MARTATGRSSRLRRNLRPAATLPPKSRMLTGGRVLRSPPVHFVTILRKPIVGLSEGALERFTARARRAAGLRARVNVVLTTSREVRALNRAFRGHDEPTDVLSFPAIAASPEKFAGDIVISAEVARRNARQLG